MKSFNIIFTALILCAVFQLSANAQTKTWTNGTGNELYDDPDNWSPLGVPQLNNEVIIPPGSIVNALIPGNRAAGNITVGTSTIFTKSGIATLSFSGGSFAPGTELNIIEGSIDIQSGGTLTINGEFNSIGTLTRRLTGGTFEIAGTMNIPP